MVKHRNEFRAEKMEKLKGGIGILDFLHFFDKSEMSHCRLFAEITLPPGTSIGEHVHEGEAEYVLILKGSGTMLVNGKPNPIGPGDVSMTGNGNSHSLINSGTVPLVALGIVITDAA